MGFFSGVILGVKKGFCYDRRHIETEVKYFPRGGLKVKPFVRKKFETNNYKFEGNLLTH
jgi:hypothetical protein